MPLGLPNSKDLVAEFKGQVLEGRTLEELLYKIINQVLDERIVQNQTTFPKKDPK